MNKKLIALIVIVGTVFIIGAGGFLLLGHRKPAPVPLETRPSPAPQRVTVPRDISSEAALIFDGYAISPALTPDGKNVVFFDQKEGVLKTVSVVSGQPSMIHPGKFTNVIAVHWSPSSPKAVLEHLDDSGKRALTVIDYSRQTTKQLEAGTYAVAWAPDGKQLAFAKGMDAAGTEVFIFNADTDKSSKVLGLAMPQMVLYWPAADVILFHEKPAPGVEAVLFDFDPKTQTLRKVIERVFGINVVPAPDGQNILVSYTGSDGRGLALSNIPLARKTPGPETERIELVLDATLAEKCGWFKDAESVLCAVPTEIQDTLNLPFDVWTGKAVFNDGVRKFNIQTGAKTSVKAALGLDAAKIIVSGDESALVILDRQTSSLYGVKLR